MKEIVTCSQMKALDARTIEEMGVPSCVLMERAALKVVEALLPCFKEEERVLVVCGSGNNGGDGIAVARLLHLQGIRAEIYFLGKEERMTAEAARQWKIAENYQVPRVNNPGWDEYTTIVDAIFGVGLARPVEGRYAQIIREMNGATAFKAAVDIPSGVDGDSGLELGIAFRADLTVTFAFRKRGLCFYPGRMYGGRIVVADIGIYAPHDLTAHTRHLEKEDLALLPKRVPYGNKGTFGKVLLVAGSEGMCGAAFLSACAALKAGAGMVRIQTVEENRVPLQTLLPEAMVSCCFEEVENEKMLDWCDVLVIGPGLGVSGKSRERAQWFLTHASETGKPVILDADGLNLLALHEAWKRYLNENVILTPHIGEMSRLCEKKIGEIQGSMVETAAAYSEETRAVCVLKDACTVVADAAGDIYLNISGNAGMATAGSGDVLSGILAAVCCMYLQQGEQSPSAGKKAALGVFLHGICGDLAADKIGIQGMTARDIIRCLPEALRS
ncbi:bifunctional ADP-dependent NAD(P)H-hydrate dehydratase/NAD(P)H-hydrate epimerase [Blautia schinkii]|nr:bifunctional ADP-dependent NAD(P)H-hydrate dehydratase/NAD(P)H-hydrate epimerase [Blautia schinkii]